MAYIETIKKMAQKPFCMIKHDKDFLETRLELIEIFRNKDIILINALIERIFLLEYMFIENGKELGYINE